MQELNCLVATLKPSQAYFDALSAAVKETEEPITLEALQADTTALIIPPVADEDEANEFMSQRIEELLQNELDDWGLTAGNEISVSDFDEFQRFFTIEYHSVVFEYLSETFADEGEEEEEPGVH